MPDSTHRKDVGSEAEPVIEVTLTPTTPADAARLPHALQSLAEVDPTFRWSDNSEGGIVLAGWGELHLEILVHKIREEMGVAVATSDVQIAYREAAHGGSLLRSEPVMRLMVTIPPSALDAVLADLGARGAEVRSTEHGEGGLVLDALVPLAGTSGYAEALRTLSEHQGSYTMQFDSYAPVGEPLET